VAEAKHLAELNELLAGAVRQSAPNHTREHDIPHPRSPDQREGLDLHQEIAWQLRYWGGRVPLRRRPEIALA
jgi:hypothetical protein